MVASRSGSKLTLALLYSASYCPTEDDLPRAILHKHDILKVLHGHYLD